MIIVNRVSDNIVVSCRDQEYNVMYSKEKFEELLKVSEESTQVKTMDELNGLLEKVESLCSNDYQEKVEKFHPELTYQPLTQKYYLKLNDKIISDLELPSELVWRIEESMEKGISIDPIIKFWKRALRNKKAYNAEFMSRLAQYINMTYIDPSKVSEYLEQGLSIDLAREKAKTYEVKITQEGLMACYKTSNEHVVKYEENEDGDIVQVPRYSVKKSFNADTGEIISEEDERDTIPAEQRIFVPFIMGSGGDAFYCEGPNGYSEPGHFIKVGCVHRLPDWSYVNTNDHASCVKGLHLGGLSYIASWNGADIHTCFVDPMHIGAIPDYSGDKAIRVLQYFVYGSLVAVNHNIYHSSEYAKKTDEEWAEVSKEILERLDNSKDETDKCIQLAQAL